MYILNVVPKSIHNAFMILLFGKPQTRLKLLECECNIYITLQTCLTTNTRTLKCKPKQGIWFRFIENNNDNRILNHIYYALSYHMRVIIVLIALLSINVSLLHCAYLKITYPPVSL